MPRLFLSFILSVLVAAPNVFATSLQELSDQRHGRALDELWERGALPPRFEVTAFEYKEVLKVVKAWLPKPASPADIERRDTMSMALLYQITSFKRIHDREDLDRYLRSLAKTYLNRMKMLDRILPNEAPASLIRAYVLRLASEGYFTAQTAKPEYREYLSYIQHYHHRLMQRALASIVGAGLIWQSGYHEHPYLLLSTAVLPVVAGLMKLIDLRRFNLKQPLRRNMARIDHWLNQRWMRANDVKLFEPSGYRPIQFDALEMREACDRFLSIDASTRQTVNENVD